MATQFEQCLDMIKLCSLDQKISLLKHLQEDTKSIDNVHSESDSCKKGCDSDHFSFEKFVSYHRSFIDDSSFLSDIWSELESLDLYRPNSKKTQSCWLSPNNSNEANSIQKFPNIMKLLNQVSKHESVPNGSLDCCNIICYSNDSKTLRLHSDNESNINQAHPICTFSIGAQRCIELVPHGSNYTHVVRSLSLESNSLYTMHSGCQAVLQHRVLRGSSHKPSNQVRYSVSFRKCKSDINPDRSHAPLVDTLDVASNPIPATLIAGDSFPARLDKERIGKKKKVILNIADGGNRIPDVVHSLKEFRNNSDDAKYVINQIFVSVGTNDIGYCYHRGVSHLKGELFGLVRTIKNLFPNCKIHVQSLLPLPVAHDNREYIIRNVLDFNKLIYHVCSHEKVFILNVFRNFLFEGYRNPKLFNKSATDIHPNSRGLGILARAYIDRVHGRYFDPLSPN